MTTWCLQPVCKGKITSNIQCVSPSSLIKSGILSPLFTRKKKAVLGSWIKGCCAAVWMGTWMYEPPKWALFTFVWPLWCHKVLTLRTLFFACVLRHGNDGISSFPGADKDGGVFPRRSFTTAISRVSWNQLKKKINQKDALLNRIRCQKSKT